MPGEDVVIPSILLPQATAITFISGIFLGLYLISVVLANRWLILTDDGWSLKKKINWYIFIITNILAGVVLVEQAAEVNKSIAKSRYAEQGHEVEEYVDPTWRVILKCAIFNVAALLADAVLMYRLWNVYGKRVSATWVPVVLWIGGFVCLAMQIKLQLKYLHDPNFGRYEFTTVNPKAGPGIVIVPFLASNILLNAYCTGLLIMRIWRTLKSGDSEGGGMAKQFQFLIRILMESGVLYLSITIVNLAVYFGPDSFPIYVINMLRVVLIGIAYNLIIIRVGKNKPKDDQSSPSGEEVSALVFSTSRAGQISAP